MGLGMWMLYQIPNAATAHKHFGGSAFPIVNWIDPKSIGLDPKATVYVGFVAVIVNAIVAALVTLLCRVLKAADGIDATAPDDYTHDPASAPTPPPFEEDEVPDPVPVT